MNEFLDQRQSAILTRLSREGRVVAGELAREFSTSEDTIRRDLRDLAAAGLCRRVYGGALPVSPASGDLRKRMAEAQPAKIALGRAAAALVEPGQIVIIDAGSTNLYIAQSLPADADLTVVTNAPAVAACLHDRGGTNVVMVGGRVDPRTGAVLGTRAFAEFSDIRADVVFLGTCAVAPDGLAAFGAEEASIKRLLVGRSGKTIAAVTNDKLLTQAPFRFARLHELETLVVEADAPDGSIAELGLDGFRIRRALPAIPQEQA